MKRSFIFILTAVLLFCLSGTGTAAQSRYGVIGGMSFFSSERHSVNRSTMNKYHVGVTYQVKLPLGFSVQAALQYNVKGAKLENVLGTDFRNTCDLSIGYLELPVSFQWGPDLLLFRPFFDVTPFVGYGLTNKRNFYVDGIGSAPPFAETYKNSWKTSDLNRWEYGLGLGIGLEIWKFQLIGRYNWSFGSLYNFNTDNSSDAPNQIIKGAFSDGHHLSGFTLSVSFLF